jgi:hypothetical protein
MVRAMVTNEKGKEPLRDEKAGAGAEKGPAGTTTEITALLRGVLEESFSRDEDEPETGEGLGWIYPSSLARGCILAVAFELLGAPKAEPESRVKRIFQVGSASHHRILNYFSKVLMAREVPFLDEEYRLKGRCDALLFIPPGISEPSGFYVLEIKTAGSMEYSLIKGEGRPRPEHSRQCHIYIWGIERYYGLPVRGGVIYYENRDTLEYMLFPVEYDEAELLPLLERVKALLPKLREGELPQDPIDRLPPDHWAHEYCPYLEICGYGQEAVRQKMVASKEIPDAMLAKIIAERIVIKRRKEKEKERKRKGPRSLEELAEELGWARDWAGDGGSEEGVDSPEAGGLL